MRVFKDNYDCEFYTFVIALSIIVSFEKYSLKKCKNKKTGILIYKNLVQPPMIRNIYPYKYRKYNIYLVKLNY